jgi:hypothetical protein
MAHYSAAGTGRQSARSRGGTTGIPQRSVKMEYRGIEYSVVQGKSLSVWRWRVRVGKPEMLRLGEAATEQQAKAEVHALIDRVFQLEQARLKREPKNRPNL